MDQAIAMAEGSPTEMPSSQRSPGLLDDDQTSPNSGSKSTGTNPFISPRSATAGKPPKKNILGGHPSMDNMMEDLGVMLNSNAAGRTNVLT
jgi:hypothetical protein